MMQHVVGEIPDSPRVADAGSISANPTVMLNDADIFIGVSL